MLSVNNLIGFGSFTESSAPPVITYITSLSNSGGTSTFSAASIGTASSDRYVVAIAGTYNNGSDFTTTGLTFDGNAGTEIIKIATGASLGGGVTTGGMYGRTITSGTTSDIVVSWSGTASNGVVLHIFTITGLQSTTPVATAQLHSGGSNSNTLSGNVNTSTDGVVLAGYFNVGSTLSTWTGVSTGAGVGGSDTTQTTKGYCGSATGVVAATPRTVSAAPAGAGRACILSASFR